MAMGFSPLTTRGITTPIVTRPIFSNVPSKNGLCHSQRTSHLTVLGNEARSEEKFLDSSVINGSELQGGRIITPLTPEHIYEAAIKRTIYWVAAAGLFGAGLFLFAGAETGQEFFAGYLLEQSLSVDNLLVFLLLFEYFQIPLTSQDRVLRWGIIGAIIMRGIMIGAGAVAIKQFHGVLLVFAVILIYSSLKVLWVNEEDEEEDLSQNNIVQFSNRVISSTDQFDGDRFFTIVDGVRKATPLFLCMIAVEISDIVFAVDSIPAVFGITEVGDVMEHVRIGIVVFTKP